MNVDPAIFGSTEFADGIVRYNAREFWDAHEAWEALWRGGRGAEWRDFVQGLIQVAAAFHKLYVQGDPRSSARILGRALRRLELYPVHYGGVDVGSFVSALRESMARIETLPSGAVAELDLAPALMLIPR